MTRIIGVRFRHGGKMYYFNPGDLEIRYDDAVIVETARGIEYGRVKVAPMMLDDDKIKVPLKEVVRLATAEDTAKEQEFEVKEKEALKICREKILERGLEMKLIAAEYVFDDSKLLFYFTADGRIDFRELVKDLAGIFRRRIELRQIGVRDETKILGGMGICGRPLCCHTYLSDFAPVSIKMAKEQNLSLNPTKISGCCGRLMCCLNNEAETYCELKKGLPSKGDQATVPDGRHGEVFSVNILRQSVKIIVDTDEDVKEMLEYPVSEISFIPHSKKPKPQPRKKTEEEREAEKAAASQARREREMSAAGEAADAERGEGFNAEASGVLRQKKNDEYDRHGTERREGRNGQPHEAGTHAEAGEEKNHNRRRHKNFESTDGYFNAEKERREKREQSENDRRHPRREKPDNAHAGSREDKDVRTDGRDDEARKHRPRRRKRRPGEGTSAGEKQSPENAE